MTTKQMIKQYLTKYGYDGLYNDDDPCCCLIRDVGDCMHARQQDCKPGYKVPCNCEHGCDYHITNVGETSEMLRLYMRRHRFTEEKIALKLGCDQSTVNRILKGERKPRDATVEKIKELVGYKEQDNEKSS